MNFYGWNNLYCENNKPTASELGAIPFIRVGTNYDIETLGTYVQLQVSNDSSNSLVTASGVHLYTLFSFQVESNFCLQYAFTHQTSGCKLWKRSYIWWTDAWSTWEN